MFDMMKKVKEMQTKMAEMQAELENMEIEGQSGGGLVKVTLSGKGAMKGLNVDPSLMNPEEADVLEDLIIAAYNDAKQKTDETSAEKMKEVTGDIPLPPGMNLF